MTTIGEAAGELREDIPLKTGSKSSRLCSCSEECLAGSKFINIAFGTLTLIITVALLIQIYYGDYQVEPHGSVATDNLECSKIGTSILKQGGNSVDAAIASAFCLGVVMPYVTGLEGEGEMLIYNHRTRITPIVINFSGINSISDQLPRLVLGLAFAHQQYGSVAWKDLVQPAADVAKRGFLISRMLTAAIRKAKAEDIMGHLEPGQLLKQEVLGQTLERVANTPEDELYKYITHENQPTFLQAIKASFRNYDVFVPNSASSGPILFTDLQRIEHENFTQIDTKNPEYMYKLAEITREVYNEVNISSKFHHGTSSNVAVIDLNDNYVSLVTGMYTPFGAREMTPSGYLVDVKDRTKNCARLPLIVIDRNVICGRRFVFGASDAATAAQVVSRLAIGGENVTNAIEAPRFRISLNGTLGIEEGHAPFFEKDVLTYLEGLGRLVAVQEPYDSCNIVEKTKDDLSSHSDSRGGGIASRF